MKKKKNTNVFVSCKNATILILLMLTSAGLFAQTTFSVRVTDQLGRRVSGVIITFEDTHNKMCPVGSTNNLGIATFNVQQIPNMIFAYDSRSNPVYGAACLEINQSRSSYEMTIPFAPQNEREVSLQINNLYETIRRSHGYYSTFDFVQKTASGGNSQGVGVPGVFSISALPTFENGKAMMEVSGVLAEFIFGIYYGAMQQIGSITGNDAVFQYHIGRQAY